jgi:ABC-type transport system involved in multi-copper enzyme maturation permease subunit
MIEAIIYIFSVLGVSFLFLIWIDFGFNKNYESVINLVNLIQRMAFTLFGASLISQIVIDEYKNKTISIVYSYPIKREKILLAKILLMFSLLGIATFLSYVVVGSAIYVADISFSIITNSPTFSEILTLFVKDMVIQSFATAFISFIPLFYFGIVKRATVATVISAIVVMQIQNAALIFQFNQAYTILALVLLGVLSVLLSVITFRRFGGIS